MEARSSRARPNITCKDTSLIETPDCCFCGGRGGLHRKRESVGVERCSVISFTTSPSHFRICQSRIREPNGQAQQVNLHVKLTWYLLSFFFTLFLFIFTHTLHSSLTFTSVTACSRVHIHLQPPVSSR